MSVLNIWKAVRLIVPFFLCATAGIALLTEVLTSTRATAQTVVGTVVDSQLVEVTSVPRGGTGRLSEVTVRYERDGDPRIYQGKLNGSHEKGELINVNFPPGQQRPVLGLTPGLVVMGWLLLVGYVTLVVKFAPLGYHHWVSTSLIGDRRFRSPVWLTVAACVITLVGLFAVTSIRIGGIDAKDYYKFSLGAAVPMAVSAMFFWPGVAKGRALAFACSLLALAIGLLSSSALRAALIDYAVAYIYCFLFFAALCFCQHEFEMRQSDRQEQRRRLHAEEKART